MKIKESISGVISPSKDAKSLREWMDRLENEGFNEFKLVAENEQEQAIVDLALIVSEEVVGLILKL